MSGYQFIHFETYARIPNKKFNKQGIWGIVHEAERTSHACLHIEKPQRPITLYGESLRSMSERLHNLADNCIDSLGRKIRKDAQLLLAGVASYPQKHQDMSYCEEHFQHWLKNTTDFLKQEFGENLRNITLHLEDEDGRPHVHYFAHPEPDENNILNIRTIHFGMRARDSVSDKGLGSGKRRRKLYKDAMRAFQDRYYNAVSIHSGMARLGPKRQRMTRKQWRDEQSRCEKLQHQLELQCKLEKMNEEVTLRENSNSCLLKKVKKEKKQLEYENEQSLIFSQSSFFTKSKKVRYLLKKNTELKQEKATLNSLVHDLNRAVAEEQNHNSKLKSEVSYLNKLVNEKKRQFELIKEKYVLILDLAKNPRKLIEYYKNNNKGRGLSYER